MVCDDVEWRVPILDFAAFGCQLSLDESKCITSEHPITYTTVQTHGGYSRVAPRVSGEERHSIPETVYVENRTPLDERTAGHRTLLFLIHSR